MVLGSVRDPSAADLRLTKHGERRLVERGISEDQVKDAMGDGQTERPDHNNDRTVRNASEGIQRNQRNNSRRGDRRQERGKNYHRVSFLRNL
jgi:hypothetical protein